MSSISENNDRRGDRRGLSPFFCSALWLAAILGALLPPGCARRPQATDSALQFAAPDGVLISAHRYTPIQKNPPGLILLHRLGADKLSWAPFAVRAQQSGYLVVSVDLRGHGGSRDAQGNPLDYKHFTPADWQMVLLDVVAAKGNLLRAGADPANLFIAGEALGASLALQYAAEDEEIQGLVMLSPSLDDHGIAAVPLMETFVHRPTLLVWSEADAYAAASADTLRRIAPGHVEVHAYPGTAHGTDIFVASPQAMGQILAWLGQMRSATPAGGAGDQLRVDGP